MRSAKFAVVLAAALFIGMGLVAAQADKVVRGKKVYAAKECSKCHMIAGKGNKIGKLDGVATKLSAADIKKWLTDPLEMEKKLEKPPKVKMSSKAKQMKLTDADVEALVAYMLTLK